MAWFDYFLKGEESVHERITTPVLTHRSTYLGEGDQSLGLKLKDLFGDRGYGPDRHDALAAEAGIVFTVKDPTLRVGLGTISVDAGYVSVTPEAGPGAAPLSVEVVSVEGGLALVVFDPRVEISIDQGGLRTWRVKVKVFG